MRNSFIALGMGLAIAGCITQVANAQTAETIIKKNTDALKAAKTYQAVILMTQNLGAQGSMTIRMEAKTAGHKSSIIISPSGKASGAMAARAATANMTVVNDGVNTYTYAKANNSYSKSPSPVTSTMPFDFSKTLDPKSGVKWMLAPAEKVNGRDSFVLKSEGKPNQVMKSNTTKLYIDKSNYHLIQMKSQSVMVGGPQGPVTMSNDLVVQSEAIDQPIAPSAFIFSPPAGAKLMTGGVGAGMPPKSGKK